jgi:hypothetical protein
MKQLNKLLLLIILIISAVTTVKSQISYDFGFKRFDSIPVFDSLGNPLDFPWTGGLNSVHFNEIDMNLDGKKDLLVFDSHGDKKYTFINRGVSGQVSYKYEPKYENLFPNMIGWVQLHDYNNDGKNDLYTYVPGGIALYKNISTQATGLKFQMVSPMLNYTASNGNQINIFVTAVDYPGIVDVDNDGDLDILTFHILGTFIVYYKNLSMEMHGDPSHLVFKEYDKCWGKFAESEVMNSVYLNTYCNYKFDDGSSKSGKHTGSTLLPINLNNDTLLDLLLGDVDFFTIIGMINGGTVDSAHMISQDTLFPSYDTSINIVSFPVMSYIDIDNDSTKELLVSPFESSYYKPQSLNSVWMYENDSLNDAPKFRFVQKNFFQDRMIDIGDQASPEIVDVDGDGIMDILMTNYGIVDSTYFDTNWYILWTHKSSSMTWYKNTGTATSPAFKLMDRNKFDILKLRLTSTKATFGDLDNDGDMDMILGNEDGKLIYFEDTAGAGNMMAFAQPVYDYQNIDVGEFSTPELFDIDGDSLLDLVIGKKSGWLSYYKNTGTKTSPQFTFVTDSMGHAVVTNYWNAYSGYSNPEVYRDDRDSLVMMVGSASGKLFYFRDIQNNITDTFGIDTNLYYENYYDSLHSVAYFINEGNIMETIAVGLRSSAAVYDFDNDGFKDMVVGNFSGGLNYFKGIIPQGVGIKKPKQPVSSLKIYPNPAKDVITLEFDNSSNLKAAVAVIFTVEGKYVTAKRLNFPGSNKIYLGNLPTGVYFIRVETTDYLKQRNTYTRKLMIYNR